MLIKFNRSRVKKEIFHAIFIYICTPMFGGDCSSTNAESFAHKFGVLGSETGFLGIERRTDPVKDFW